MLPSRIFSQPRNSHDMCMGLIPPLGLRFRSSLYPHASAMHIAYITSHARTCTQCRCIAHTVLLNYYKHAGTAVYLSAGYFGLILGGILLFPCCSAAPAAPFALLQPIWRVRARRVPAVKVDRRGAQRRRRSHQVARFISYICMIGRGFIGAP